MDAVVILCCLLVGFVVSEFNVKVEKDGSYKVVLNGKNFLESASTGLVVDGSWYSSDGELGNSTNKIAVSDFVVSKGSDIHGTYEETVVSWETDGSAIGFQSVFKDYDDIDVVLFSQVFPDGTSNTVVDNVDDLMTCFPSFQVDDLGENELKNYITFHDTFNRPIVGHLDILSLYHGGFKYGPLVVYDQDLNSVIISPISHFMVGQVVRDTTSVRRNIGAGINGKVEKLPKGFQFDVVIAGSKGIDSTFQKYGDFVLKHVGRKKKKLIDNKDVFVTHLSYYTDNGAYYYYITEPGKNYEETMIDVVNDVRNKSLPVRSIQYDSWWYFKAEDGGLDLWEPRSDIFPNGMEELNKKIQLPVGLHNRWFGHNNAYKDKLNFTFYVEEKCSLPKEKDVFQYLMKKSLDWGTTMYEQDWLSRTSEDMIIAQKDLAVGKQWIKNMLDSANELGLTFQLCMPYFKHISQTLELVDVVTHIRASDDYHPRRNQFDLGLTSALYWSLGFVPFKDNFWSSNKEQKGCKYDICKETNPELQTIIATLSGGTVGFSDKIGMYDVELLLETCDASGKILKADRPSYHIDHVFASTFHEIIVEPHKIFSTYTCFDGMACSYFIFQTGLLKKFELKVDYLPIPEAPQRSIEDFEDEYYVIKWEKGKESFEFSDLKLFSKEKPFTLGLTIHDPIDNNWPFEYYSIHPVLDCGFVFLKEAKKIVGVSKQRISSMTCGSSTLDLQITGVEGEEVLLSILETTEKEVINLNCKIESTKTQTIACKDKICKCGS